jgi:hypothetical protein
MASKGRVGRPAKGGGRLGLRLSSHARALLGMHTTGQSYEGDDGDIVVVPPVPAYANMTAMAEHGITLAARRDLVPMLDDNPAYRACRKSMQRIVEDLGNSIRISLACFFKRYGRGRATWNADATRQKQLINSLIWTRGRLILALAREAGQPAPEDVLKQLRALACEERFLRMRRR